MRLPKARNATVAVLVGSFAMLLWTPVRASAGTSQEYFTDEEVDFIRDAQGLTDRVPAILKLANIRLVTLAMREKTKEDRDLEKRIAEIHEQMEQERTGRTGPRPAAKPEERPSNKPATLPDPPARPYLGDLTRVEILRGYVEAMEEIGDDIDEAYRQKQPVRKVLDQFQKFCSAAIPALRRFHADNAAELQAIDDARMATQDALENAEDALKKIPKTDPAEKPEKSLQP